MFAEYNDLKIIACNSYLNVISNDFTNCLDIEMFTENVVMSNCVQKFKILFSICIYFYLKRTETLSLCQLTCVKKYYRLQFETREICVFV